MTTRSDVYSAAAVLYFLLTGRTPYTGDLPTVLRAHVSSPVPVLAGFAPRLTDLLKRAMAKRPEERPADASAFLAELEQAAQDAYGAAWLSRASVAGLVTAGTAAGGSAAVFTGGTAVPAAAGAVATGRRILGIPKAAFLAAVVVAVLAVAGVAVALTVKLRQRIQCSQRTTRGGQRGADRTGNQVHVTESALAS